MAGIREIPSQKFRLSKVKEYPRPHDMKHAWQHGMERGSDDTTIYPLMMYDEGLGAPSAYEAHPEHASFVTTDAPNVFPESRTEKIFSKFEFSMTKGALETDKVHAMKFAVMVVKLAFIKDYTAIDELSSLETQDIVEYQTESTDRQGYPLYIGTKMVEKYAGSGTLATIVPGLTTTQVIEKVTFVPENYYDMLAYGTISNKLKTVQRGLKWYTLTRKNPVKTIMIKIDSKVKAANEYSALGVMIHCPRGSSTYQIPAETDITNISHMLVQTQTRFNEWHHGFNMERV